MRDWDLVGVPYTSMARPGGIAEAIGVLRAAGLVDRLDPSRVHDAGDLRLDPPDGVRGASGLLNERALVRLVAATREAVLASHARGRLPLLVGGDCPVLLGPLAAIRDEGATPGLLMFDGHEDAWSPARSGTGEASDSEVAIAIGTVSERLPPPLDTLAPFVDPAHVALLGPRDADELAGAGEPSIREQVGCFFDDRECRRAGPEPSTEAALLAIGEAAFWLHVDLDVLATEAFAAVDYPQPGGLTWHELDSAVALAVAQPACRGASVAIYNPDRDPDRSAAIRLVSFLATMMGAGRGPES